MFNFAFEREDDFWYANKLIDVLQRRYCSIVNNINYIKQNARQKIDIEVFPNPEHNYPQRH